MNKIKKDWKNLKEQVTLNIQPPERCQACDFTPEDMRRDFEVAWLEHRIPNTNFVFYVCPNCHTCSGNRHAVENAKIIREQQTKGESKILQPSRSIILPGQN